MTSISRVLRHLFFDDWRLRKAFNRSALAAIEKAIGEQERRHRGELRFVIEAALPAPALWRNYLPRQRALDLFASLGVWDTEENSGVLIYVLLADKDVEIVADRGINSHVDPAKWEAICAAMQTEFSAGRFEAGALEGIRAISDLLATHYPARANNPNELSNTAVVF